MTRESLASQKNLAANRPTSNAVLTMLYLLAGPFVVLSQRYLTLSCDSYVISHYRAFTGSAVILLIAAFADRPALLGLLRHRGSLLLIGLSGLLLAATALLFLEGMRLTSSLAAALAGILTVPLLTGVSIWLFHDERPRRPRWLIAGIALVTLGAIGYAWTGRQAEQGDQYAQGVMLLAAAVICTSAVVLLSKHLVRRGGAFSIGGLSQAVAAVALLAAALARGVYQTPAQLGLATSLWLTASGAVGMLVGAGLGMVILRRIGILRRQMVDIWTPPLVGIFALLFFGERILLLQVVFMLTLLIGCLMVIAAGRRSELAAATYSLSADSDNKHQRSDRQPFPDDISITSDAKRGEML